MSKDLIKINTDILHVAENSLKMIESFLEVNLKKYHFLHVDDHSLFRSGVLNCVLQKYPNADIRGEGHGNLAFEYIKNILESGSALDLVITDIAHPGLSGLQLCTAVREFEKKFSRTIPFLFITMHNDKKMKAEAESHPLVKFLSKNAWSSEIKLSIEMLLP